ncbi:hypothetical protein SCLCIDRAFT_1211178 [Scleroderma citrinum Foug A]|uniref:Uncharacterized protein n=1 Tax=Scleroderma citrinum Foug A TaxID=1036808 RepID=A0A0C3EDL9_9AGAM|nr:hypothetical protein SCLCIDRAFT_1211178 [Scleroderma citrinum Foug A]
MTSSFLYFDLFRYLYSGVLFSRAQAIFPRHLLLASLSFVEEWFLCLVSYSLLGILFDALYPDILYS